MKTAQQADDNPLRAFLSQNLNDPEIKNFHSNEAFRKLPVKFDIDKLREAHEEVLKIVSYDGLGVNAICLNQIWVFPPPMSIPLSPPHPSTSITRPLDDVGRYERAQRRGAG